MDKVGYPKISNYNEMYRRSSNKINISTSISLATEFSQEMIKNLFGNIKTLTFDLTASCACGHLKGNYYIGAICPKCKMLVSSIFCRDLDYRGWIIVPSFLPQIVHPQIYNVLEKYLYLPKEFRRYGKRKDLTMMDWLLDPSLPIKEIYPNLDNGLTYFNKNMNAIFQFLFSLPENMNEEVIEFIDKYYENILIDKIPVVNEYLHLITQQHENSSKFQVDSSAKNIMEVYSQLCSLTVEQDLGKLLSTKSVDRRMYKIQQLFLIYPDSLIDTKIIKKPGLIRRSCISGRMHFTARSVIIPITTSHYGDEVILPWEIMVVAFKSIILNHLIFRWEYTPQEAISIQDAAIKQKNHPVVKKILRTILDECRYKGWPLVVNRNPSVRHGSSQEDFAVDYTLDDCIHISTTSINSSNADFDFSECFECLEFNLNSF